MTYLTRHTFSAVQFTGTNYYECAQFLGMGGLVDSCLGLHMTDNPVVQTDLGPLHPVQAGEWIVKHYDGRFSIYSAELFSFYFYPAEGSVPASGLCTG